MSNMELKEIMSVSGQTGLFRFISQARNGIIVESFTDKKRSFVSALTKVSSLEDIAVFTENEEVPLKDIFKTIDSLDSELAVPQTKALPDELKKFMEQILPDYDQSRVYVSDIRKIVNWYAILKANDLLKFESDNNATESDSDSNSDKNLSSKSNLDSNTK